MRYGPHTAYRSIRRVRAGFAKARQMSPSLLIVFCGFLLSLAAFSIDITLPAFYSMSEKLAAPIELVQMTVPVYGFTFGAGQLLFGAASDRFGRKPVLVFGLLVYLVGSVLAFFAFTLDVVLFGRFLQGLGAASHQVVARAILRDRYEGRKLGQAMAIAMAIFAFGPVAAPLLGHGLTAIGGWRFVFAGMFVFAALLAFAAMFWFVETNERLDRNALKPATLLASLKRVLGHRQSRFFTIVSIGGFFAVLSYVANAPRFFQQGFGVDGLWFAVLFAVIGVAIVPGQVLNNFLIGRYGLLPATRFSAIGMALTFCAMALADCAGMLTLTAFTALLVVFSALLVMTLSNGSALTLDPHHDIAGFTSSFFGFTTQLTTAILIAVTVPIFDGNVLAWSLTMTVVTGALALAIFFWRDHEDA